ncbi:hypothetical protein SEA_OCTOBIEN14_149 [Gordonia phage Octobien14]|uniref:Uncharacterized protein n=1 Tax=Gordonia phage Octobien14 TaxID=2483673 RepID=A0A3G3MB28_9CAUD|nr:hypothetical protein L3Y22_gp095 [Gordonia phage Octobien14]AYR03278.1 hypothetical protein SEA_OCTOBIEN14_149 [Gordonia phage Octobien14]
MGMTTHAARAATEMTDHGTHVSFRTAGGVGLSAPTLAEAWQIVDALPDDQWVSNRGGYLALTHGDTVSLVRVPCADGACTPDRCYNCTVCGYWVGYWG